MALRCAKRPMWADNSLDSMVVSYELDLGVRDITGTDCDSYLSGRFLYDVIPSVYCVECPAGWFEYS